MKNLRYKTILVALCLIGITHYAYSATNQTATYKNQRNSIIKLEWHSKGKNSGTLSGTFKTAVGNCKRDMNVPVPILGYYNGNVFSISINFPHCGQVVAMTGNINKSKTKIRTIWLDSHIDKNPLNDDWNSNLVGTDYYNKVK